MDTDHPGELEGQSSINELLQEPVGDSPIQLVLPIHVQLPSGKIRRLTATLRDIPADQTAPGSTG